MEAPAMAEPTKTQSRPKHAGRSFTRMEEAPLSPSSRKRASTLQEAGIPAVPAARQIGTSPDDDGESKTADVFESHDDDENEHAGEDSSIAEPELHVPSTFDELPIEIRSLAERFLERLSAKVHPTPFTAESLSDLFQEFYERAAGHISTHIATLSARLTRDTPRTNPKTSAKGRPRAGSVAKNGSDEGGGGGEMLTVKEVADRKKARRMLEVKRLALEEAVERGVCEKVYDKIWKHRTTDDDARDEKLRSRTAALALVGIGLKELHMDPDSAKSDTGKTAEEKEQEIHQSLSSAREALQRMDDERYPLGKLQHLTAAHKSIVDTLSQSFPTSSSADEILPTLIYTLITSPPEGINVVSNLNFIQRFRASTKVDGEAAYCLVNLEAAISFLETVDLSSLRADEAPEGPPKTTSGTSTPTIEKSESAALMPTLSRTLTPGVSPITATANDQSSAKSGALKAVTPTSPNSPSRPQLQQRRISTLVAAQAKNIEAGRDNFLNAADKVYDSINGSLDNSLQFLFGRFKEQVASSPGGAGLMDGTGRASVELPKTLEDARKLVNSPHVGSDEFAEEEGETADRLSVKSGRSGGSGASTPDPLRSDNKMLELLGGKRSRERSVDSTKSGGSAGTRRVTWDTKSSSSAAKDANSQQQGNIFTSAASTINSINPLNRFGMPGFPRFGRAGSVNSSSQPGPPGERDGLEKKKSSTATLVTPTSLATHDALGRARTRSREDLRGAVAASNGAPSPGLSRTSTAASGSVLDADDADGMNAREALARLRKCKPPRKRFLDVSDAGELKLNEVEELLKEYRRLAKAVGEAVRGA